MDDLSINVSADGLAYVEDRLKGLFGKDAESVELREWFRSVQTTALTKTESVQCLGMREPVPFSQIYQSTRLIVGSDPDEVVSEESINYAAGAHADKKGRRIAQRANQLSRSILRGRAFNEKTISTDEFLRRDQDALIFSGPGWGKTTLMHHLYRSAVHREDFLPVLITLRRPTAIEDLEKFVGFCSKIQKKQHRACSLLLVDGYDEVDKEQQRRVSEALLQFQSKRVGKFYLTCREYYAVAQLTAPEVRLDAFSREDQVKFVDVFLRAYGCPQDALKVVEELESRGFEEFLSHPLLLTLACIVKTSPQTAQPRSSLRLLQQALNVLCYQWDEQKHINRKSSTPLEGQDRIDILANIAYKSQSAIVKQERAEEIARRQLTLMRFDRIDPVQVLLEIAQFYGILVPTADGYEFVHRTIQDYLGAKKWVESGDFGKARSYAWTARTGYAACLLSDATEVLKKALEDAPEGLPTAAEILSNAANYDKTIIAKTLLDYFSKRGRVMEHQRVDSPSENNPLRNRITGKLESDVVRLADSDFLDYIVEYCCSTSSAVNDLLVAYAVLELYQRRAKLRFKTYEKALGAYKTPQFTFSVPGAKQAQLGFLNPEMQNRMKDRS